ncbi:zinc-binding dehydrogenase [Agromyces intestinalis]|uniref:Zinc-binding dehydrogenase n=1 Tax=Agromyces intestinalis TaxID=2592652 RepID=A0A5C1YEX1_9MICO|nr:alcohol dehydrogenase catalytic domain-containing protein [Agromyces intestinalis]QEO14040.1 zinc-binding dehydrogenase [Agromyces intestinalis]
MKALVYHGPGQKAWEEVPDPTIQHPRDAIVRVETTTICGTDLHILKGDVPAVTPGRILGHEAVGVVEEVGSGIDNLQVGDRVLVPAITTCALCEPCRNGLPSHCETVGGIGWIFGHLIDGTQAEKVRVPFADTSTHKLAEGVTDEDVIFLADILPTGFEIGVLYGNVQVGDTVVVVGAGPVGLASIATAALKGAARIIAVDLADSRLQAATEFGADVTINSGSEDVVERVKALTDGRLADVAIEAVGIPATFTLASQVVRPGGTVANVGVHGAPVEFPINDLWISNITFTTGLVNGNTVPALLKLIQSGRLDVKKFATHHFTFDQVLDAYDTFANAGETNALKVVIAR